MEPKKQLQPQSTPQLFIVNDQLITLGECVTVRSVSDCHVRVFPLVMSDTHPTHQSLRVPDHRVDSARVVCACVLEGAQVLASIKAAVAG